MNKLNKIKQLLELNYNFKGNKYEYFPKTNKELKELVNNLIKKYGNKVNLNIINVSNINDFNNIFLGMYKFNGDVSEWDISNGLYFNNMFYECYKFNSNLTFWDVSNAKNFNNIFYECYIFN